MILITFYINAFFIYSCFISVIYSYVVLLDKVLPTYYPHLLVDILVTRRKLHFFKENKWYLYFLEAGSEICVSWVFQPELLNLSSEPQR
jgi:hypothetical protein